VHVLGVVWELKMPMGIVLVMDVPIKVVAEVVCMLLLVVVCRGAMEAFIISLPVECCHLEWLKLKVSHQQVASRSVL